MERSRAGKKKFQMRSPFKGSIAEFMAMGKTLGKSNPKTRFTSIDFQEHYKPVSKKEEKEEESSVDELKRRKAQIELDEMGAAEVAEVKEKKRLKMQAERAAEYEENK